jgi:hypothetical protein
MQHYIQENLSIIFYLLLSYFFLIAFNASLCDVLILRSSYPWSFLDGCGVDGDISYDFPFKCISKFIIRLVRTIIILLIY